MKVPTDWNKNPGSETNQFIYDDETVTYDSPYNTYDGVVADNMSDKETTPAEWSKENKYPVAWSKEETTPAEWSKE